MERLQSHGIVAVTGQFRQPLDEAHRPVEVPAMAVVDGETEMGGELLGGGGTAHHQLGGLSVGSLDLGRAQSALRKECGSQLQLQLGFRAAAFLAFRKLDHEGDRAGEVLDCPFVRRESDRS
jgi:hypothetical protein